MSETKQKQRQKLFNGIRSEFVNRLLVLRSSYEAKKASETEAKFCEALDIHTTSLRNLLSEHPISVHILQQIRTGNKLKKKQKEYLAIKEVYEYVYGRSQKNPYTELFFLRPVPLPSHNYFERVRTKKEFQSFLADNKKRILNIYGDQGTGRTQFLAKEIARLVESGRVSKLFPDGIGYYNVNPANDKDYQTRRNVIANTVQTLVGLFKLSEDEKPHSQQIQQALRGKRLLLVMENVPIDAYASTFADWLKEAHVLSKLILISIAPLDIHDAGRLKIGPFTRAEATEYLHLHAPELMQHLDFIQSKTELRPKHLELFCNLFASETQRTTSNPGGDILTRTADALGWRLRTNIPDGHHLAGLSHEAYTRLTTLTVTRQPISLELAAAIWNLPPSSAETKIQELVRESWLRLTEYSGGTFAFHFLEHQVAAGGLEPQNEQKVRIRLANFLADKCLSIEQTWQQGGILAHQVPKRFAPLREDFWSTLRCLGVAARTDDESAEAYWRLFSSCPEVLFQMFSLSGRRTLATLAEEIALTRPSQSAFCKRAVYVAKWFASFEQYLYDSFKISNELVNSRILIANELKDPHLMFFALVGQTRNSTRLAIQEKSDFTSAFASLAGVKSVVEMNNLGPRYQCYLMYMEGWTWYYAGDYAKARELLIQTKRLAGSRDDQPLYALSLLTLSRASRHSDDFKRAEEEGWEAMRYAEATGQNEIVAMAARNLSRICEKLNRWQEAIDHEIRWLEWKESQNHPTAHVTRERLKALRKNIKS